MDTAQFELHADVEDRHWWFTARREILCRLVRALAPANEDRTVVDVGCGTGANLAALADAYRCVGIDTSEDGIRLARQRFPHVEFLQGFAPQGLGDVIRNVDVMLLTDVLEHVPDDFRLLSELLAALPVGAYLVATVPANEALWSPHDEAFGHYRRYDLPRFRRVWQGLPVAELLASAYNARLYPVVKAIRGLNRLRGASHGAEGTDFRLPAAPVNNFLRRTFAGEADVLLERLDRRRSHGYSQGVSLIAVLRREAGPLVPRNRPSDVAADRHQPRNRGEAATPVQDRDLKAAAV
ncbi:MAG: class I SAM-dependent methyltransferase [Planctomycetales bacterium]|nr:class I SAM-dependent methyltransferase [Planctomycetales bacterium]